MPKQNKPFAVASDHGEFVEKSLADKWRNNYEFVENTCGKGKTLIKAHFFGRDKLDKLLALPGVIGLRIAYALKDNGQKELLIYAVDADGNNIEKISDEIIQKSKKNTLDIFRSREDNPALILDMSSICPPYC